MLPQWPRLITQALERAAHGAPEQAALRALTEAVDRQRRPVAHEQILAQADRNRARMREKDDAKRREMLAGMQALIADRGKLKAHLLKTSMIEGLRQAAQVT
jgi:3-(3-hydroxy-phenyl)propionate hydroxylase